MRQTLTLIFILFLTRSYCQDTKSKNREKGMSSIDVIWGNCLLTNNFNSQFNTIKDYSLFKPIQIVGIGMSGAFTKDRKYDYHGHISYAQVVPQKIVLNDTLNAKINGFIFSFDVFGLNLAPNAKFASCILSFGFNTGRFRISDIAYKQQKNPFFSPTISLQPKLRIGKVALSLRGDFSYDISKRSWRSLNFTNKTNGINLSPLKQTGGIIFVCLGWRV